MEESLTGVLTKVCNEQAAPNDVRDFLDHLLSQNLNYAVTWQTIEAFKLILDKCTTDDEVNEELLDVLFDSFNYITENCCDENSWSDFNFELGQLIAKFLSAIQKSPHFGYFFCKLLLSINYIVKHYQDVWKSVARLLMNIFINKKLSFDHLQDSLKSFIYILRNIDSSAVNTFAQQNLKLLSNFSLLIQSVGDFESQFDILEIIFLHIQDDRQLAREFFTQNEEIANLFQNLNFKKFEVDCRIFINSLNRSLEGKERKVITINCNQFSLGGRCLELLEEEKCIWLDANIKSKRLSIACSSFDSDTISLGSRCLIFIPMMDVIDFKAQVGTAGDEDCYCFRISISNLTQSYQASTSNEIICTALHSCNGEEEISYFMQYFEYFRKRKSEKTNICTEGLIIKHKGLDKENVPIVETPETAVILPNFTKLNRGFLKEKKIQDNMISSSNVAGTTALDLFKDDKEAESRPKRKSYGIFIGGGLTEPMVFPHGGAVQKLSSRRNVSSDEGGKSPRINISSDEGRESPRRNVSSDESGSSPRRSERLKNRSETSYCEDDIIPGTLQEAKNKNQSSRKNRKNSLQQSPTELLQEKIKKKILPKVQSVKDKPKKGKKGEKKLFSSQDNGNEVFDALLSEGPVLDKSLPLVTPKKITPAKKRQSVPRQRKSLLDKTPKPKKEEKLIKNTSLLDPNGYAYKRWTSGVTSERSKFWENKIKKLETKKEYESESIYDFSEDESDVFKKKTVKKTRGRKKKGEVKDLVKVVGMTVPKSTKKSEPKNRRKSSDTPKAKLAKAEKNKRNSRKPEINVEKVPQKTRLEARELFPGEEKIVEAVNHAEVDLELQPECPTEILEQRKPVLQPVKGVTNPDPVPFIGFDDEDVGLGNEEVKRDNEGIGLDNEGGGCDNEKAELDNEDRVYDNEEIGLDNEKIAPFEKLMEDEKAQPMEVANEAMPEEPRYEEVVPPPNDFAQDPNPGHISSDESQGHDTPRNYDNLILGQESSDDQFNNNVIVKELNLNSLIDPNLPIMKIDYSEGGNLKIFQSNSKEIFDQHRKAFSEKGNVDETVKDQALVGSINPCSSLSLNSSTHDTNSSPRVVANPLKTRKRYRKKKRDMNSKTKRKSKESSSEEEKNASPKKFDEIKIDQQKRKMKDLSSEEENVKPSPKKVCEMQIKRKTKSSGSEEENKKLLPKKVSEKRKLRSSSSEVENVKVSLKKIPEAKSKLGGKNSSSEDEKLELSPKKTQKFKKRKLEESSDEFSEEHEEARNKICETITRFKEKKKEKNKMEMDRIIETVMQGNNELLKSLSKKDALKLPDLTKKLKEDLSDDSLEEDLSKKCERFKKCVTYFSAGCSVSDLCKDMNGSISKVLESLSEEDSEDGNKDEEKIRRFSTRLEAVINCQTEAELKDQLKSAIGKMLNVLSFGDDVNFY